ncbi:class I SAM-dependent methyltransferase [Rossellomorea sp. AcN35-11]|nr:class I SAM-dependent methyltransferase [Rossellomorea aquimaris]WJV29916.1 class I SAM-dependent methyltransferase [Rossellomorea sp. AcN35-11]
MNDYSLEEYYKGNENPWTEPDEGFVNGLKKLEIKRGKAIDLGAGEGGNSFWLAKEGFDVVSIDLAPTAVQFIRSEAKRRSYRIHAEVGNIVSYESNETFDLALLSYVHLPKEERLKLFSKINSLLKDDGVFIYLGFFKDRHSTPEGASPEEFPSSKQVAEEWLGFNGVQLLEQQDEVKTIPIGHQEGSFEGVTTKVIVKKGWMNHD